MSWLGDLFAGGVEGTLKGAGSFAKDVREAITGEAVLSGEQKARLIEQANAIEAASEAAASRYQQTQLQGQIDIAKVDQASQSGFQSGWRPFTGWVCASGFAYMALVRPILPGILHMFGVDITLEAIDTEMLYALLTGMLGLGGFRTYEKVKTVK